MNKAIFKDIIDSQKAIVFASFLTVLAFVCGSAPVCAQAVPKELMQQFRVLDPELTDKYKAMYKDIQTGDR